MTNRSVGQRDLIFSQFLMKEWRTFCIWLPPWAIICRCYRSKFLSYFSRSTCLFRYPIVFCLRSISRWTIGIRPLHFSSSPYKGTLSSLISCDTRRRASVLLRLWRMASSAWAVACCSSFSKRFWSSRASCSSFFSWMRLEHSCSRFLRRSVSRS